MKRGKKKKVKIKQKPGMEEGKYIDGEKKKWKCENQKCQRIGSKNKKKKSRSTNLKSSPATKSIKTK